MKITFLGTRGGIKARSAIHHNHSSTLLSYYSHNLLIDCGADWLDGLDSLKADALIITHAHTDHVDGLKRGSPFPVYATQDVWRSIEKFPIKQRNVIAHYQTLTIAHQFKVEVFPVIHSIHAPAVGFRITAGKRTIFYVSDLIKINKVKKALTGVDVYIGDGARISRPLIRKTDSTEFGHASIKDQLQWCKRYGIKRALFTHCGSEIVKHDMQNVQSKIKKLAEEYQIPVLIAYDGMEYIV